MTHVTALAAFTGELWTLLDTVTADPSLALLKDINQLVENFT